MQITITSIAPIVTFHTAHIRHLLTDFLSGTWVTVSEEEEAIPNDNIICNEILDGEQDVVTVTCD